MPSQPVIVAAKRTPIGRFMGGLSRVPSPQLGSYAIKGVLDAAPGLAGQVDEVIMGCVLQAGVGQAPARQAALKAGLPDTMSCKTINKVCGSGLEAVMLAAQAIKAGDAHAVIAGGFESMSLAPHMAFLRAGLKYGNGELTDHMAHDGLRCAFEACMMGDSADFIAQKYEVTRAQQDAFAARSHQRAAEATAKGYFKNEILALTGEQCLDKKSPGVQADEGIRADSTPDALAKLRPAFAATGTVTAGNASQISDGAAALAVLSHTKAEELRLKPVARVLSYATSGVAPKEIFRAPSLAIPMALQKAGLKTSDIDLFEINEAFAAQALQNIKELKLDEARVNVCGGGVALGHPIGASGARVLVTLLHQLHRTGGKRGVAALCLGGGNAVAMVVEV